MTAVVRINDARSDPNKNLFFVFSRTMDSCLERILNEWNISRRDRDKNAMVIPSALSAISHNPLSM